MAAEISPEIQNRLALAMVPGLGPKLTAALIGRFGSTAAVRRATAAQLREIPHIGAKLSESFVTALAVVDLNKELQLLDRHGVQLVSLDEDNYPAPLRQIANPPHLLFVRGAWDALDVKAIAIVGSREYTSYGRKMTERIAAGMVRAGYTVISGLARGIDGFAHRAALEAGGRTIAVLAGGLSRIYPPEHSELADQVASSGALITETPMQLAPQAGMFPARNRLISGLSRGVLVVEAHERSGALITAHHALEQDRDVFALPGGVDASASAGCLQLIRDGAKMIRSAEDIIEDLEGIPMAPPRQAAAPPPDLDGDPKRVWDFLAEKPRFVDEISNALVLGIPELGRILMQLELKKLVRRLPGNHYERQ